MRYILKTLVNHTLLVFCALTFNHGSYKDTLTFTNIGCIIVYINLLQQSKVPSKVVLFLLVC